MPTVSRERLARVTLFRKEHACLCASDCNAFWVNDVSGLQEVNKVTVADETIAFEAVFKNSVRICVSVISQPYFAMCH